MALVTRKPVTLEDLDDTLADVLKTLQAILSVQDKIVSAVVETRDAVTKPYEDGNRLEAALETLVAQGRDHGKLLAEILNRLKSG